MLLPRSQWQWVLDQPDDILSTSEPHFDTLGASAFVTHRHLGDWGQILLSGSSSSYLICFMCFKW